ncbi:MAG: ABC transporter permease [Cyclobacteriaceae bacterium]|nr:MAG: ABC transporter permease [Cyclobacteriaceae bacterium]
MFDLDKWEEIFNTLQKNKLRTALTAFGVFWGILMLIILLGAGQGLQNGVAKSMLLDATNSIWFFTGRTSIPYKGMPPGRALQFTEEDLKALKDNIEGIQIMSPENWLSGNYMASYNGKASPFVVYGANQDYFPIKVTFKYINGRPINRNDNAEGRKVCNIGDRVAEVLFGNEDPIGKYIRVKDVHFKVVGVFHFDGTAFNQGERIYIPFTTFQRTFNPGGPVTLFAVGTDQAVTTGKELEQRILKFLAQRHIVHPDDNQAFWTHNQEDQYNQVMGLMTGIKTFVWVIGVLTLFAGIIGISNIMIIVVKDRTREIGIRKAVGATPGSIISLILQEAIFITGIAGYLGLLTGILTLEGINHLLVMAGADIEFFSRPEVDLNVAISATVVLVIAGAIAGLFPALKASGIRPIEALKDQ